MNRLLIVACISILASTAAFGCEPAFEAPFAFEPPTSDAVEVAPPAPAARVQSVERGRRARGNETLCKEIGSVTIAIRDDAPGRPFVFAFRQIDGEAPDTIFPDGVYAGSRSANGERLFTFYWPDIAAKPAPLDLDLEITSYTRHGVRGASTVIEVRDGDRGSK